MFEGKIIKGVGGLYTVSRGDELVVCNARGVFRKEKITPCIGDNVTVNDDNCIEDIKDRKNILIRPPVANIDHLAIVVSAQLPYADTLMLDKLTVSALSLGIEPMVLINKCDIATDDGVQKIVDHLKNTDILCFAVDCVSEEGINRIVNCLKRGVTAFAGQSGVGKTSILNTLLGDGGYEVGQLSEKLKRGRHTTRHVELHRINEDVFVVDTPGFSKYDAEVVDAETLGRYFPEFVKHYKGCAFNSCSHTHEPDCNVKKALENGEISRSRYNNYIKIYEQIKQRKANYR